MGRRRSTYGSLTRRQLLSRYGHLYLPFKPPGVWFDGGCVYCGLRAEDKDHIPPLSWMYALGPDYFDRCGILIVTVPSCKECNSALGSKKLFTIKDRTLYLVGYYSKRYDRLMRGEAWSDAEIMQLRGNLKRDMTDYADYQLIVTRRIEILEESLSVRSMPQAV